MNRLIGAILFSPLAICTFAQTVSQPVPTSDPQAISLAQNSIMALTGGVPITDVTLNANVTSIFGSDNETGIGIFRAKGIGESRVDLTLSGGTLSEVRSLSNSGPAGAWSRNGGTAVPQSAHNTVTDAVWFFPALSSLSQFGNPNYVFKYIGEGQHGGVSAQHIQVAIVPPAGVADVQHLSTVDFYLDPISFLPMAADFMTHPDDNMRIDIPVEILFAGYRNVNGVAVPFHVQKLLNGGVVLDLIVTTVSLNTGLLDTSFSLQ